MMNHDSINNMFCQIWRDRGANVFSLKNGLIDDPCIPQNFEKYRPHKGREEKTSSHPWDPCGEHGSCSRPAENRAC